MNIALLEQKLREQHKHQFYLHWVALEKPATGEENIAIAQRVLDAPLPWALGLALEFERRQYPPGYDGED
jgi:hypothetical protein